MRKLKKMLKDKRGMSYIGTLIFAMVGCFFFIVLISIIAVGIDYIKVVVYTNYFVSNAVNCGAIETNSDAYSEEATHTGLDSSKLTYIWNASYYDESTGKLAFKQPYSLAVTYSCKLPLFMSNNSITIPVRYVGRDISEVFWK